jgi:hypothetical protein
MSNGRISNATTSYVVVRDKVHQTTRKLISPSVPSATSNQGYAAKADALPVLLPVEAK